MLPGVAFTMGLFLGAFVGALAVVIFYERMRWRP